MIVDKYFENKDGYKYIENTGSYTYEIEDGYVFCTDDRGNRRVLCPSDSADGQFIISCMKDEPYKMRHEETGYGPGRWNRHSTLSKDVIEEEKSAAAQSGESLVSWLLSDSTTSPLSKDMNHVSTGEAMGMSGKDIFPNKFSLDPNITVWGNPNPWDKNGAARKESPIHIHMPQPDSSVSEEIKEIRATMAQQVTLMGSLVDSFEHIMKQNSVLKETVDSLQKMVDGQGSVIARMHTDFANVSSRNAQEVKERLTAYQIFVEEKLDNISQDVVGRLEDSIVESVLDGQDRVLNEVRDWTTRLSKNQHILQGDLKTVNEAFGKQLKEAIQTATDDLSYSLSAVSDESEDRYFDILTQIGDLANRFTPELEEDFEDEEEDFSETVRNMPDDELNDLVRKCTQKMGYTLEDQIAQEESFTQYLENVAGLLTDALEILEDAGVEEIDPKLLESEDHLTIGYPEDDVNLAGDDPSLKVTLNGQPMHRRSAWQNPFYSPVSQWYKPCYFLGAGEKLEVFYSSIGTKDVASDDCYIGVMDD